MCQLEAVAHVMCDSGVEAFLVAIKGVLHSDFVQLARTIIEARFVLLSQIFHCKS